LAGIVPLLIFKIPHPKGVKTRRGSITTDLWFEFKEGVSLVWSSPGLRRLYGLIAGVVLVVMPSFTLVPLLVKSHFGGGAYQVALMEGLSGIGMVCGGLLVAVMVPRRHILWVLLGFSTSCLSLSLTALVPEGMFAFAVVWWFFSGMTFVFANAPLTALLQTMIPLHVQGRALSLLNT
ncbi:MFS transporter, partial [Arthrospira platensis SPKY1]|nr:MFS transporter [Arthrospira platensis SPKY1]